MSAAGRRSAMPAGRSSMVTATWRSGFCSDCVRAGTEKNVQIATSRINGRFMEGVLVSMVRVELLEHDHLESSSRAAGFPRQEKHQSRVERHREDGPGDGLCIFGLRV